MHTIQDGTVDHYLSVKNHRNLTYEWDNYRFASNKINNRKRNADDKILDPFEVKDEWFEILLPSCRLSVTDQIPDSIYPKAKFTIKRLRLNNEILVDFRRQWYDAYQETPSEKFLKFIDQQAPLIAQAIRKQQNKD